MGERIIVVILILWTRHPKRFMQNFLNEYVFFWCNYLRLTIFNFQMFTVE